MATAIELVERIHARAVRASNSYKRGEAELVEILEEAERLRVPLQKGHSSLFDYVTDGLGLAENLAYTLITVARKCRQVPELLEILRAGQMTISNARRVAAVIQPENKDEWLRKACELSHRELEKEIARVFPGSPVQERASYVNADCLKLEVGLSEAELKRLKRAQDLLCQSRGRFVTLEETISELATQFLWRHDPVEKASRHRAKRRKEDSDESSVAPVESERLTESVERLVTSRVERTGIPAEILHQVNWRDQRRCTYLLPDGRRCDQTRWIEIHHIRPVSQGGSSSPENLTTLCAAHHRYLHET